MSINSFHLLKHQEYVELLETDERNKKDLFIIAVWIGRMINTLQKRQSGRRYGQETIVDRTYRSPEYKISFNSSRYVKKYFETYDMFMVAAEKFGMRRQKIRNDLYKLSISQLKKMLQNYYDVMRAYNVMQSVKSDDKMDVRILSTQDLRQKLDQLVDNEFQSQPNVKERYKRTIEKSTSNIIKNLQDRKYTTVFVEEGTTNITNTIETGLEYKQKVTKVLNQMTQGIESIQNAYKDEKALAVRSADRVLTELDEGLVETIFENDTTKLAKRLDSVNKVVDYLGLAMQEQPPPLPWRPPEPLPRDNQTVYEYSEPKTFLDDIKSFNKTLLKRIPTVEEAFENQGLELEKEVKTLEKTTNDLFSNIRNFNKQKLKAIGLEDVENRLANLDPIKQSDLHGQLAAREHPINRAMESLGKAMLMTIEKNERKKDKDDINDFENEWDDASYRLARSFMQNILTNPHFKISSSASYTLPNFDDANTYQKSGSHLCHHCQSPADFACSKCKKYKFCSKNHLLLDWALGEKSDHYNHCS